ncbi:MAG: PilZ domain-containing protein [Oligoflexia bacterium]|nr:PilZ domain-containing protein [Oligoflexia bacterium]
MAKQIQLYPIGVDLKNSRKSVRAAIVKLSAGGFLVNSYETPLLVNEAFQAEFVLPGKEIVISGEAVVFKTYDEFKGKHGLISPGNHVNELVWRNPSAEMRSKLAQYLAWVKVNSMS